MQPSALEPHDAVIAEPPRYTYAELCDKLPETTRPCELWDGELIMSPAPSVSHQEVVLAFYRALYFWVAGRHLGRVYTAPLDMVLSPHQVVQPDVLFVATERRDCLRRALEGPADLVAEVLSLGSRTRDRIEKRDLYQQYGTREYWIIDPQAQTAEVLSLESTGYRLAGSARGSGTVRSILLNGFSVKLDDLFAGITGGV